MPRLNDAQTQALGYWWNLITDAVKAGFTTTETISIANDIASNQGRSLSFETNGAIASLYGYARREYNASQVFQNADPSATITPDMISTPPYARPDQEMASYPLYYVKFNYTYIDQNGEQQTDIRTSVQPLTLGQTVQDVSDDVQTDATAFAAKYNQQLVSATPFQILAV